MSQDTSNQNPPGYVLTSNLRELVAIADEVGAETSIIGGFNTKISFHVKGPATVIIAYPVEDGELGL